MESEIKTGKIIWFNIDKCYGFIAVDGATDGKDLFLHCRGLRNIDDRFKLQPGVKLQFLIEATEEGKVRAINVEII